MSEARSEREAMVRQQLEARGIRDPRLLEAMRTVPREHFVPRPFRWRAFDDCALPIADGQTISQPYVVAAMIEALELSPASRVLEIGTGSGYAAAVLAELAAEVVTVERIESLAVAARARLVRLGYDRVLVVHGDGSLGWPGAAPYDAILVSAGAPDVPPSLEAQLADAGRMVLPLGHSPLDQVLVRLTRQPHGAFRREVLGGVRFVPLVGREGWPEGSEG